MQYETKEVTPKWDRIDTGLTGEKDRKILDSVLGQLSDGYWENSPAMQKYWQNLAIELVGDKVIIRVHPSWKQRFDWVSVEDIKRFFAVKLKFIAKVGMEDAPEATWSRDCDYIFNGYFQGSPMVKDVYRCYDKLLGRKERITVEEKVNQTAMVRAKSSAPALNNDLNTKIINKLMSISKALADEFGFDQKLVLQDMINDLRLAGGEDVAAVLNSDKPIDELTKQMAQEFRGLGLDSNIALQALLQMDEKESVKLFKDFIQQSGGLLPDFARGKPRALRNKPAVFLESFGHRILLDEALDEIHAKYYTEIPPNIFTKLINADPTFVEENDRLGTYGKWILALYKKELIKLHELAYVQEVLQDFDNRKRYITTPNGKDIFTYKTIHEVRDALNNIELSKNQIAKMNRKAKQYADLGEEAKFIGENKDWEIWRPETYAASCKLGAGTHWCTASTSGDGYYHRYTSGGSKLYIFIPKSGEVTNKWQVHIKNNEAQTFADFKDNTNRMEFSEFIFENDLLDVLKNSELKHIDAVLDVENYKQLDAGKPYLYAGGAVKDKFKDKIKVVEFVEDYPSDAIPALAFYNCINLEKVYMPETVKFIGSRAFEGCTKVIIYTPPHQIICFPADIEFLRTRIKIIKKKI